MIINTPDVDSQASVNYHLPDEQIERFIIHGVHLFLPRYGLAEKCCTERSRWEVLH